MDILASLPAHFASVAYSGACIPDGRHDLSRGANCQAFTYAVLAHFGANLPPWRSSDLWLDETLTRQVTDFAPLDLLLFNASEEPYGAHVAVYVGEGRALHLCKAEGMPAIWPLQRFALHQNYQTLIGAKRIIDLKALL